MRQDLVLRLKLHGRFSVTSADAAEIPLKSKKAKALLAFLARPVGKVRSRDEIVALLWSDREEAQGRASLRQVLFGLRKELGDAATGALCVSEEGLRLDPARVCLDAGNPGDEFLAGLDLKDPAFEDWVRDERLAAEDADPPRNALDECILPNRPAIAVLALETMGGAPSDEAIADGISQDIISALSKISRLVVIARSSSFTYKGQTVDVKRVGQEQGVRFVLQGTLRRSGPRLRITAELSDAQAGHHLWVQRYDRQMDDVFDLQDEIMREVISSLQIELTAGEQARLWLSGTRSHAAWEMLLGIDDMIYGHRRADILTARARAERALEIDSGYATAWVWLGWSHVEEVFNGWSADSAASLHSASDAAERAHAIDPGNADVFTLLACTALCRRDFDAATAHGETAMALGPSNAFAIGVAAMVCQYRNRPDSMIPLLRRSMQLSPIYPAWNAETLGGAYLLLHRNREAAALAREAVTIDPDYIYGHIFLAIALVEMGATSDAAAAVRDIQRIAPDYSLRTFERSQPFEHAALMRRHLEGLRRAGLPE